MQQYMVQIIKNLKEKGYRQLNPESNNVYGRADSDAVYIVVIGSNHNLDSETLKKFNNKILLDVSSDSHRKVNLLNILITPNGMFDDMTKKIVEELDNVWLFAEDYGKLYIFENQPTDFDSLYDVIDKKTVVDNRRIPAQSDKNVRCCNTDITVDKYSGVRCMYLCLSTYGTGCGSACDIRKRTILQIPDINVYTFWNSTSGWEYGNFDRTRCEG